MVSLNLIRNGGFEDDFSNWVLDMDNRITSDACTGEKAALVYNISQRQIPVAVSTIHYLRFRYKLQPHKLIPIIHITAVFGAPSQNSFTRNPDTGEWSFGNAILTETPTANGYMNVLIIFQSASDINGWGMGGTLQFDLGGYPRDITTQFQLDDVYLGTSPPPPPPPPNRPDLLKYALIALGMIGSAFGGYLIVRKRRK